MLTTTNNESDESSEDNASDMLQRTGTFHNQVMVRSDSQSRSRTSKTSFYTALTSDGLRQKSQQKLAAVPEEVQILIDDANDM